jgi:hypothetical protein
MGLDIDREINFGAHRSMNLEGKVAVITGAARGIGRARRSLLATWAGSMMAWGS